MIKKLPLEVAFSYTIQHSFKITSLWETIFEAMLNFSCQNYLANL